MTDEFAKYDLTPMVEDLSINKDEDMNKVSTTDVTLLSLSLGAFSGATTYLVAHDYTVAGGLFAAGLVLIYLYHKLGSTASK